MKPPGRRRNTIKLCIWPSSCTAHLLLPSVPIQEQMKPWSKCKDMHLQLCWAAAHPQQASAMQWWAKTPSSSLPHQRTWFCQPSSCQQTLPISIKITPAAQAHTYIIFEAAAGSCGYIKQLELCLEHLGGRPFPIARYWAFPCFPISPLHDN